MIPDQILKKFEELIEKLEGFGTATLIITLHDSKPRYTLEFKKNIIPGKNTSGSEVCHD